MDGRRLLLGTVPSRGCLRMLGWVVAGAVALQHTALLISFLSVLIPHSKGFSLEGHLVQARVS